MLSVFVSSGLIVKFSVAAVSHPPVVDATVVLYVPAVLYAVPCQVYGSWAVHTAMLSVFVSSGLIVKFSVAAVSHPPVVDATVVLYVPAVLYAVPCQLYGSWAVHTAMLSVFVSSGLIVKFSVAAVSHPPVVDATVVLYVPAVLYAVPCQLYGSWAVHTAMLSVFVSNVFTTRFNVAAVSHPPVVEATVVLYVPAVLYAVPCQLYGSWAVHTAMLSVFVSNVFTTRFS